MEICYSQKEQGFLVLFLEHISGEWAGTVDVRRPIAKGLFRKWQNGYIDQES